MDDLPDFVYLVTSIFQRVIKQWHTYFAKFYLYIKLHINIYSLMYQIQKISQYNKRNWTGFDMLFIDEFAQNTFLNLFWYIILETKIHRENLPSEISACDFTFLSYVCYVICMFHNLKKKVELCLTKEYVLSGHQKPGTEDASTCTCIK